MVREEPSFHPQICITSRMITEINKQLGSHPSTHIKSAAIDQSEQPTFSPAINLKSQQMASQRNSFQALQMRRPVTAG